MRSISKVLFTAVVLRLLAVAAGAQQVTLPLDKFEELRARANPEAGNPVTPPAPWALELAEYAVKVGPESARVAQTLRLTLYDDQWQTVPLGEAGAFIAADFKGTEGRVEVTDKGLAMHVRGRGRREVRLESAVPVTHDETATRPTWRFALRFPAAAVVRGRIEAPPTVEELDPEGSGLVAPAAPGVPGAWTFVALPSTEVRWTLSGKAMVPQRAQLPLRYEATSVTSSTLSRTRLQVTGWIEARVAQGSLETLRIPVPPGLEVADVRGPSAGWKVEKGVLIVTPLAAVEDKLAVEVDLTGAPQEKFATPLLVPEGSARTFLLARAALKEGGLLTLADHGSARAADDREVARLPESLRKGDNARLFAVADAARPPLWEAAWAEGTEVLAAQVDRLLVDVAVGESGRASYQLWAEVRNRGTQQLTLTLPPGFELAAGYRDGVLVVPGTSGGALSVPLLTQEARQVVHLEGLFPLALPKGDGSLTVPLPSLSAPVARVEVRVIVPGGRSYELVEKARAGQVSAPPWLVARQPVTGLAAQANSQMSSYLGPGGTLDPPENALAFFHVPPGFTIVQAAWSALSATPPPLAVRVEKEKEKSEWF